MKETLVHAIKHRDMFTANLLINNLSVIDLKGSDDDGNTILHLLIKYGSNVGIFPKMFETLILKLDSDTINAVNNLGETALYRGVLSQKILGNNLKLLLNLMSEAAINSQEHKSGNTVLHIAALNNEQEACEEIVKASITIINILTFKGKTALDLVGQMSSFYMFSEKCMFQIGLTLCSYGADFADYKNVREDFRSFIIPNKLINHIVNNRKELTEIKLHPSFDKVLTSRFKNFLGHKIESVHDIDELVVYKRNLEATKKYMTKYSWSIISELIDKSIVIDSTLIICETQLTKIIESTNGEFERIALLDETKLMMRDFLNFKSFSAAANKICEVLERDSESTQVGVYLKKIFEMPEQERTLLLGSKLESIEILHFLKNYLSYKLQEKVEKIINQVTVYITVKEEKLKAESKQVLEKIDEDNSTSENDNELTLPSILDETIEIYFSPAIFGTTSEASKLTGHLEDL